MGRKMENIDRFNKITAAVLGKLYSSFPVPITIDCYELARGKSVEDLNAAELKKLHRYDEDVVFHVSTVAWLRNHGYLEQRHDIEKHYSILYEDCVLTPKALEAMNAEATIGEITLGEQLTDIAKDTGGQVKAAVVAEVVGALFKGFFGGSAPS